MAKIDGLDQAIITVLHSDARLPSAEIARKLNESPRTVHNRIQHLVDDGVIELIAVVNPASFGYHLTVDIFCEIEAKYLEQAVDEILKMPSVTYVAISTGDQDISLQAIFKDSDEMQAFITQQLHQVPGMHRTRTVLLPRILKNTSHWLPGDLNADG